MRSASYKLMVWFTQEIIKTLGDDIERSGDDSKPHDDANDYTLDELKALIEKVQQKRPHYILEQFIKTEEDYRERVLRMFNAMNNTYTREEVLEMYGMDEIVERKDDDDEQ